MAIVVLPSYGADPQTVNAANLNGKVDPLCTDYNGNIENVNISASAGIVYSKLALTNGIVNADINSSAAIVDTKLATISTAAKVNVSALTGTGIPLASYITTLTGVINLIIDGGGSAITTGVKLDVYLPIGLTITESTLLADQSGSIVLDLWVDTYSAYPPTVADTITASAKPTLSSATKAQDATLTGWTAAIAAGKSLRVNVDSASTVTRVVLALKYLRTS